MCHARLNFVPQIVALRFQRGCTVRKHCAFQLSCRHAGGAAKEGECDDFPGQSQSPISGGQELLCTFLLDGGETFP